jgi:hypothetical protein
MTPSPTRRFLLALAAALTAASLAPACPAQTPPASPPATPPATPVPPPPATQPDSPEEALVREATLKFADALVGSDPEALRGMFVGVEDDVPALLGLNRLLYAQTKLREAVIAKLPDKGGRMSSGPDQREAARTSVLSSPIIITGDSATILAPNGQVGYKLAKKDGTWKVEYIPTLVNIKPMLPMLRPTCEAMLTVADEVTAGKYHNEVEVRQAILKQAQLNKAGAASGPASRP